MELSEYKNIFDHEKEHFFYVTTHGLVLNLIRRYFPGERNLKILDAGCGTGGLATRLSKFGKVNGIDFSDEAVKLARVNGVKAIKASVERIPFPDRSFDLVTSIDVIYHRQVKNDVVALKEMRRVLRPGGFLTLRVPAHKFLMSAHDRHVHTTRRYEENEIISKLEKSDFEVLQCSFVHSPIFLLSLVKIMFERLTSKGDHSSVGRINPIINLLLTRVLNLEGWLIAKGISLPFGQGLICVAQRDRY